MTSEAIDEPAALSARGDALTVFWADGRESLYHAIWLRHNCPCPGCRSAANGQRIFELDALHQQ